MWVQLQDRCWHAELVTGRHTARIPYDRVWSLRVWHESLDRHLVWDGRRRPWCGVFDVLVPGWIKDRSRSICGLRISGLPGGSVYVQQRDLYGRAGWERSYTSDEQFR